MSRKIRLAVVDDHPVVRRGVIETFSEEGDFELVGEGGSADDAVRIARQASPDLMLLDVSMPGGGVEAVTAIRAERPDLRIAMLSIREDLATVRAALKAGAKGFISKGIDSNELVVCARKILGGGDYVSPELAARLLSLDAGAGEVDRTVQRAPLPPTRAHLTLREEQIFRLLGEGLSNSEIAQRIGLTENTVKHYITPLLHKLGVRNRTEAALLARGNPTQSAS